MEKEIYIFAMKQMIHNFIEIVKLIQNNHQIDQKHNFYSIRETIVSHVENQFWVESILRISYLHGKKYTHELKHIIEYGTTLWFFFSENKSLENSTKICKHSDLNEIRLNKGVCVCKMEAKYKNK